MHEKIPAGTNPRSFLKRHSERGPERFSYTTDDLAKASGYSAASFRTHFGRVKSAARDGDILSVSLFLAFCTLSRLPATEIQPGELPGFSPEKWAARWPLLSVYRCRTCGEYGLESPFCERHGGPLWSFNASGHFCLLFGGKVTPYYRLVSGASPNMWTFHTDRNKWNNRRENLEVITAEEFQQRWGAEYLNRPK